MRQTTNLRRSPRAGSFRGGRILCAALLALVAVYGIESASGIGGRVDAFFDSWVYNGLLIAAAAACLARGLLVQAERRAWLLLGAALSLWTLGDLYYFFFLDPVDPPIPSLADGFYLAFYPLGYAALALILRSRVRRFEGNLWLDGVIAALAVAAIGAAVVFNQVLESTGGSSLVVATNLAYPLADVLLLSLIVGIFALTGWRFDLTWALAAAGFAVFAVADSVYLYETAVGRYSEGGPLDVGWPAALALIAFAAWQRPAKLEQVRGESWQALTIPTFFAAVSLSLLVYDHFDRIDTLALLLASAAIGAVIVRAVLAFRDRARLLTASREEALTDALTGLGNRRRFIAELEDELAHGDAMPTLALVVFDLDGFKAYNDSFGHAAGDALLGRVAGRLAAAAEGHGRAYRLGGDEFCVLASTEWVDSRGLIERAAEALSEEGEGFTVRCSYGAVLIPIEARELTEALRIADDRMYVHKLRNRSSADRQSIDILVSVLNERDSRFAYHLANLADLAEAVGRRLRVPTAQLETIRKAAELHDVGKLAIPEEILAKPGPLTDDEWEFVRRHTLIGERILASAPALVAAARIVRSTHERWDGSGYPDRLERDETPTGARIISVCDAFDAMTSSRSYAEPLTREEALHELSRCAGTQFDPEVVEAFAAVQTKLAEELVA